MISMKMLEIMLIINHYVNRCAGQSDQGAAEAADSANADWGSPHWRVSYFHPFHNDDDDDDDDGDHDDADWGSPHWQVSHLHPFHNDDDDVKSESFCYCYCYC